MLRARAFSTRRESEGRSGSRHRQVHKSQDALEFAANVFEIAELKGRRAWTSQADYAGVPP